MAEEKSREQTVNISKGTVIYDQGEEIHSICIIAKGKVLVQNDKFRSTVSAGGVIGAYDLFKGNNYLATYTAADDTVVVNLTAETLNDVKVLCEKNTGYGGLFAIFFCQRIKQLYSMYQIIKNEAINIGREIKAIYDAYNAACSDNFIKPVKINEINKFCHDQELELDYKPEVQYYVAITAIEQDVQKKFLGSNRAIYMHHIEDQYRIIDNLQYDIVRVISEFNKRVKTYVSDRNSIYSLAAGFCEELGSLERDNSEWLSKVEKIKLHVDNINILYRNYITDKVYIDKERIEKMHSSILNGEEEQTADDDLRELYDSYDKIMEYGGFDSATINGFWEELVKYDNLEDKMAVDRDFAAIREGINRYYYKIYLEIFKKAVREEKPPLYIRLFLEYGFVSEKFLTEQQLQDIVRLQGKKDSGDLCKVYTLFEWLKLIYSGKKEPSKSEFDLDYAEYLRDQLKQKAITDQQSKELAKNRNKKLEYEVENLFKCVNRLLVTKATAFVPILHKDNCVQGLYQSRLTSYRINTAVKRILDIDFSLFSREVMYANPKADITKDFVIKEAYPDVILFPCYGTRGVMWQDISGKKRDTEGRIIYPILFEGEEYPNLVGVMGRFRWELCKTIQGIKWNDIRIKSLTSEYQDYIQFFRKNSALSDEWKEKVNRQIKSARSNTREIFVGDYTEWILRESSGGMRLSKCSREILATYCPFTKAIRENLERMPIYQNAMKRFNVENKKKIREYEGKCAHITQKGFDVPEEIEKTKEFYYK